jgi:hypothetical protein
MKSQGLPTVDHQPADFVLHSTLVRDVRRIVVVSYRKQCRKRGSQNRAVSGEHQFTQLQHAPTIQTHEIPQYCNFSKPKAWVIWSMSRAILSVDLRGKVNLEHGSRKRGRHVLEMMFRIALQCQLSKESEITPRLGYCVRGRVEGRVDNDFRRGDEEPALRLGLEERYRRRRIADPCRIIFIRSS